MSKNGDDSKASKPAEESNDTDNGPGETDLIIRDGFPALRIPGTKWKPMVDGNNYEITGKFPCIKVMTRPPFQNKWCYNSKKLSEKSPKFQWKCAEIE